MDGGLLSEHDTGGFVYPVNRSTSLQASTPVYKKAKDSSQSQGIAQTSLDSDVNATREHTTINGDDEDKLDQVTQAR